MPRRTHHSDSVADLSAGIYRRVYSRLIYDRAICGLSLAAEAWLTRLRLFCDDFGNFHRRAQRVYLATVGDREDVSAAMVGEMLAEMEAGGVIRVYEAAGEQYLHVPMFIAENPGWGHGKRTRRFPASPWDEEETATRRAKDSGEDDLFEHRPESGESAASNGRDGGNRGETGEPAKANGNGGFPRSEGGSNGHSGSNGASRGETGEDRGSSGETGENGAAAGRVGVISIKTKTRIKNKNQDDDDGTSARAGGAPPAASPPGKTPVVVVPAGAAGGGEKDPSAVEGFDAEFAGLLAECRIAADDPITDHAHCTLERLRVIAENMRSARPGSIADRCAYACSMIRLEKKPVLSPRALQLRSRHKRNFSAEMRSKDFELEQIAFAVRQRKAAERVTAMDEATRDDYLHRALDAMPADVRPLFDRRDPLRSPHLQIKILELLEAETVAAAAAMEAKP